MSASEPLTVSISTQADGQLVVTNNLQMRSVPDRTIPQGLTTIRQRYELYTGQQVQVNESPEQFRVMVPLLPAYYGREESV